MAILPPHFFDLAEAEGDPYWLNVVLLMGAEGANGSTTIPDESTFEQGNASIGGDAQITTSGPLAGTSSALLDGSDSIFWGQTASLQCRYPTADINGSQDDANAKWTIDISARFSAALDRIVVGSTWGGAGNAGWFLEAIDDGSFRFFTWDGLNGVDFTTATGLWTTNVTYRIRLDSDGAKVRLYLDGAMIGSGVSSAGYIALFDNFADTIGLQSGFRAAPAGKFDELRITNGICRTGSDDGYVLETLPFPRGLPQPDAFYSPELGQGGATVSPGLFTDTEAFYAPTVSRGDHTLLPDIYTDLDTFYAPVVPNLVLPVLVTDADQFHAPTVVQPSAQLFPDNVADAEIFYAPLFQGGQVSVFPQRVIDLDVIPKPKVDRVRPSRQTLRHQIGRVIDVDIFYPPDMQGNVLRPSYMVFTDDIFLPTVASDNSIFPPFVDEADQFYEAAALPDTVLAPDHVDDDVIIPPTSVTSAAFILPGLVSAEAIIIPGTVLQDTALAPEHIEADDFHSPVTVLSVNIIEPPLHVGDDEDIPAPDLDAPLAGPESLLHRLVLRGRLERANLTGNLETQDDG